MKQKLNIFKLLLLVAVVLFVALFFIGKGNARIICALFAIADLLSLFVLTFSFASVVEDIDLKNQSLSKDNSVLQQKLKKSEELRSALKEKIEKSESVRSDMSETIKRLQSFGASNGVLAQITNAVASKDEKSLIAFNKNVVAPYLSYIKSIQMPLSEDDKQMIIDKTISLAMIAVDMADTYEWDLNNREEQKINCGILNAQISIEEALSKAIQITDNPMVTPRWIRAMSTALASILSDTSNVIYSGYKL